MEEEKLTPEKVMEEFSDLFEEEKEATKIEDFPDAIREDVEGLLWLGYLQDTFSFCGHDFVIRTLRGDEELLAALISKEFIESVGQARAWAWAQIALALVSVDGDADFCPPAGPNKREYARARFQYCTSKWFWPVAAHIYSQYTQLLERQTEAIGRVEDLFTGSLPMSTPFVGSSTDRADSEEQPAEDTGPQEDIREYLDPQDSTDSKPDSSTS